MSPLCAPRQKHRVREFIGECIDECCSSIYAAPAVEREIIRYRLSFLDARLQLQILTKRVCEPGRRGTVFAEPQNWDSGASRLINDRQPLPRGTARNLPRTRRCREEPRLGLFAIRIGQIERERVARKKAPLPAGFDAAFWVCVGAVTALVRSGVDARGQTVGTLEALRRTLGSAGMHRLKVATTGPSLLLRNHFVHVWAARAVRSLTLPGPSTVAGLLLLMG